MNNNDTPSSEKVNSSHAKEVRTIQITEEEQKVLKDCTRQGLLRGLPLGISAYILGKAVLRFGNFTINRAGRAIISANLLGFGFFIGMKSYSQKCIENILSLENSAVKDELIKSGNFQHLVEKLKLEKQRNMSEFSSEAETVPSYDVGSTEGGRLEMRDSQDFTEERHSNTTEERKRSKWEEIRQHHQKKEEEMLRRRRTRWDEIRKEKEQQPHGGSQTADQSQPHSYQNSIEDLLDRR